MMIVKLPWPDRILSPNSRAHHMARAKAAREARAWAKTLTQAEFTNLKMPYQDNDNIPLSFTFCFPDARERDSDNLNSMMKAARDGIADALGINDSRFWPTKQLRGPQVDGGKVIVRIG